MGAGVVLKDLKIGAGLQRLMVIAFTLVAVNAWGSDAAMAQTPCPDNTNLRIVGDESAIKSVAQSRGTHSGHVMSEMTSLAWLFRQ